jgi:hypothetical protein
VAAPQRMTFRGCHARVWFGLALYKCGSPIRHLQPFAQFGGPMSYDKSMLAREIVQRLQSKPNLTLSVGAAGGPLQRGK